MSQSAAMGRLTADIRQAAQFRATAIDEMRQATGATLAACATMRGEAMHDYRAQTQKFLASLVKEVAAHRRTTTKHVMQMARARQKAASQMRAGLGRDVRSLSERTREFRDAAARSVTAMARAHRKTAKQQRASLESGRRKLGAEVAKFRNAIQRDLMGAHDIWASFAMTGAPAASTRKR